MQSYFAINSVAVIQLRLLPLLFLQISILLARQETGAILVDIGQFAVTQDLGVGVIDLEAAQQGYQGSLLRWGSRVGRAPMLV